MVNLHLKINFSPTSTEMLTSPGKYQIKQLKLFSSSGSLNIGFHSAFCVPSSCSPEEAMYYLNDELFLRSTLFEAVIADCQVLEGPAEVEGVDVITT